MTRIDDLLDHGNENWLHVSNHLAVTVLAMRDAMGGQPGAASYEQDRTSGMTTRYDEHGVPMPAISDPTGEAAIARCHPKGDPASAHHRELVDLIRQHYRISERALRLVALYQPRTPTEKERRETERANRADQGCTLCARTEVAKGVRRFMPVFRRGLCRWHVEWERSTGRPATEAETIEYHATGRVKRPA